MWTETWVHLICQTLFWCSAFKHWSRQQCVSGRRRRGSRGGQQWALCDREWLSVAWRSPLIQFKHMRTEWITNRVMRSSGFNDGFESFYRNFTDTNKFLKCTFISSVLSFKNKIISFDDPVSLCSWDIRQGVTKSCSLQQFSIQWQKHQTRGWLALNRYMQ